MLETILNSVKSIEGDLMTSSKSKAGGIVDPVSNFPTLTPKHNSLAANVLLNRPDLYTKYCNSVTPSGFTFDNAIQVRETSTAAATAAAATAAAADAVTILSSYCTSTAYLRDHLR